MTLDRHSRIPLHRQIAAALRSAIAGGEIPSGSRLPSTRALAKELAVSRNTVLTAYEELAAEGILTGRTGSGTRAAGSLFGRVRMQDARSILRGGHYPLGVASFRDPDGNLLLAVRTL